MLWNENSKISHKSRDNPSWEITSVYSNGENSPIEITYKLGAITETLTKIN